MNHYSVRGDGPEVIDSRYSKDIMAKNWGNMGWKEERSSDDSRLFESGKDTRRKSFGVNKVSFIPFLNF